MAERWSQVPRTRRLRNPIGPVTAVNEAWQAAGFDGTISPALVNQMRAKSGVAGNLRGSAKRFKPSPTGQKRGRPRKETTAAANGKPAGHPSARKSDLTHALLSVETEIDKLIFQVMIVGHLPQVENALREARRRVYGALNS